jgi:hypothetical protein
MPKFRKKPVVIEAVQWAGDNLSEIQAFYKPDSILVGNQIHIHTLEGTMRADVGDWIIRGVSGEFYPCKPDIFVKTYEPADALAAERASLQAEREKVKKLRGGIEKLTAKCPCWSGGFENGEFAKQPCEYCDPLMSLLAETAPEKNAGSPKEADHD